MRPLLAASILSASVAAGALPACSSASNGGGFFGDDGGSGSSSGGGSGGSSGGSGSGSSSGGNGDAGLLTGDGSSMNPWDAEGGVTVTTTVYAHSDDTLYTLDPMTNAVTLVGTFTGLPPTTDGGAPAVTDLAVNGNGDVYVNTESAVFKAAVPSSPGNVPLTQVATIGASGVYFYALGFAPAGAIDPNIEVLIGGDSKGNLWSIDTGTGAAVNLGGFGKDPFTDGGTTNIFELSGDIVFYIDPTTQKATGLATIRSCPSTGGSSKCGNDFLAGIDMTKLAAAYSSKAAAATLLGGIYGGSASSAGAGTGYHDVFGLGAWNSKVFGFTRHTTTQTSPMLITIDTTSGAGTMVSNSFSFTNGWSGAGVSSKVTVSVPPPPPPPAQ